MDAEGEAIGSCLKLPPGFRFSPTDEELILHFLYPKSSSPPPPPPLPSPSSSSSHDIIPDLLGSQLDPWDLNGKALSSGNQFFYFSRMRKNRSTGNGYWKDLEMEEPIYKSATNGIRVGIGIKNLLVFHTVGGGRHGAATDQETDWLMEEYRLIPTTNGSAAVTNYSSKRFGNQRQTIDILRHGHLQQEHGSPVLCRVHERRNYNPGQPFGWDDGDDGTEISYLDEMFMSLDDDMDDITSSYY